MNRPGTHAKAFVQDYQVTEVPEKHPSLFEPATLIFGAALGVLGIIIGLELLTRVGITPNTSIIGAVIVIVVSRFPVSLCRRFKSLARQNLMQTVISSATFGGANAILLPTGVVWLYGRIDLIPAILLGSALGMIIDATILYRVFDSRIYPARGIWPPGIATAECLIAGDQGGKRGRLLAAGAILGGLGKFFGIPMDVFGVCWIGNIWALGMFGAGLLVTGYSSKLMGADVNKMYVPHGVMVGAGLVALIQIFGLATRREIEAAGETRHTISAARFRQTVAGGFIAFMIAAAIMAALAGLYAQMSAARWVAFILFAAAAALAAELIVGIAAMHSGWFPAFATALVFLVLGINLGFPPLPLAFLVGFTASAGPAFADMGYDLKTGWILRGSGKYPDFEKQGRLQQYFAGLLGFVIGAIVVVCCHQRYFIKNLFPPVDSVFVATIRAGTNAAVARSLLWWAVPGAVIQLLGGPSRQAGILLATGMLINNPVAGLTALVSLLSRILVRKRYGPSVESPMYVLAGGFIAGSALTSFGTATVKLK